MRQQDLQGFDVHIFIFRLAAHTVRASHVASTGQFDTKIEYVKVFGHAFILLLRSVNGVAVFR